MPMYTKVTRINDIESMIPLTEVKRALNLLDTEDDDEIQDIIYAAFGLAERYCYRRFSKSSVIAEREDSELDFFIPYGENVVINSVKVDGLESTDYTYSDVSERFKLNSITSYEKLVIEYECGFETLPKTIDRGIKYLVSTIFNSGQDFVAGLDVREIPLRATSMLNSEKRHVI